MQTEEQHEVLVAALNKKLADGYAPTFEVKDFKIEIVPSTNPDFTHMAKMELVHQTYMGGFRLYWHEDRPQVVTCLAPM